MGQKEGRYGVNEEDGVRTTTALTTERRKQVNQYTRHERIGKGQHGEVFLCSDEVGQKMALKVVKRNHPRDRIKLLRRNNPQYTNDRLAADSTEHSIRREIAIMKRCRHANIASLLEVIDDTQHDKIYLVMEYLAGGEVQWADTQHRPTLTIPQTRRILRDVILGLEYLHHRGIIHRDIKPANLLWTRDRTVVKIIDFGVAHLSPSVAFPQGSQDSSDNLLFSENDLSRRLGTPSFLAPEVVWFDHVLQDSASTLSNTLASRTNLGSGKDGLKVRPSITKAIDVWSLAVTFYCFLFGHTPFNVPESENENAYHNEYMLYNQICTQDWDVDATMGSEEALTGGRRPKDLRSEGFAIVNILDRMLQKDPKERVTLSELKRTPWVLGDIPDPKDWLACTSPTTSEKSYAPTGCRWIRKASRKLLKLLPTTRRVSGL